MDKTVRSVGRPIKDMETGVPGEFVNEYKKFLEGGYGKITKRQFAKLLGMGLSTFHKYENHINFISSQEKIELKVLADDFGLLHRKDVQEIIKSCKSYEEGQKRIMQVYTAVYMK